MREDMSTDPATFKWQLRRQDVAAKDRRDQMAEVPGFRAELLGGPMDGRTIDVEQWSEEIHVPIPPGLPLGIDTPPGELTGPEVAVYVFESGEYVEPRDPFLPRRIWTYGRYRYRRSVR